MRLARTRHAHRHREIDHAPFISHPIEVGCLLHGDGQPDEIIAAGLLHDILEKTATTSASSRGGSDPYRAARRIGLRRSIDRRLHEARKRELRDRVAHADAGTRAVFAADKISKVRELAQLPARRLGETKVRAELAHYRASLEMLRRVDGHVALIHQLDAELNQLLARSVSGAPCAGPITSATGSKRSKHRAPAI